MTLMSSKVRITALPAAPPPAGANSYIDSVLFSLWLIFVALSPVWFGSNNATAWGINAAVVGMLFSSYGAFLYFGDTRFPLPLRLIAFPMIAMGLVLAWALIQTLPGVPLAWQHPVWRLAAAVLQEPLAGTITVDPEATERAVLWTATVMAATIFAIEFGFDPRRAWLITFVLAVTGGAIAAYGIIVYGMGNHWVLWRPKDAYLDALTATFINRDNYAAYAAATLASSASLLLNPLPRDGRLFKARFVVVAVRILLSAAFLLLVASLILTGSRAGVGMAGAALGMTVLFHIARNRRARWKFLIGVVVALCICGLLTYYLGHLLLHRLEDVNGDLLYRWALDRRMLAGIAASPILGYGYGAFRQAFPIFRDTSLMANSFYEFGHNDWLEAAFTLGLPGALALGATFLWILIRCVKGTFARQRGGFHAALAVALLIALGLDATVDFSMQIQGFALPFMTLLGVGIAQSFRQPFRNPRQVTLGAIHDATGA